MIFYGLSQWTLKLSIALLYLRVLSWEKRARNLIYAVIAFITVSHLLLVLLFAIGCAPMARPLDPRAPNSCKNLVPGLVAFSGVGVLADFLLIMIVLPRVIRLPVSRVQKVGLLIVINLGWVAIGVSILRLVKIIVLQRSTDFTWHALDYIIWYGVDSTIGLTCAASATIKPLLRKLPKAWLSGFSSQRSDRQPTSVYWDPQAEESGETEEKRSGRSSETNLENGTEMGGGSAVRQSEPG